MLARIRYRFLLVVAMGLSVAVSVPAQAQANGVPPSITSLGFGGNPINGIRPSVTSLGPITLGNNGYAFGSCCASFFWPANSNAAIGSGRHHHHHGDHSSNSASTIVEPAYIPYGVPYAPESEDDESIDVNADADADNNYAPAPPPATRRAPSHDPVPADGAKVDLPVAAQPSTVLVFKDGRRSDVGNYAIVGNTLFDFEADRTRKILLADLDLEATQKANDDRGVDFEVPASAGIQ